MKTKKLTKNQFAKFIAVLIIDIENYNFDMFYDISNIMKTNQENRNKTENPIFTKFHLMLRNSGSDLISPNDSLYETYNNRSSKVYELNFCWNSDYFGTNVEFCEVTQIK